jgi:acetyltransferase-like isoleucine patch superfamily enzyme
MRVGPFTPTVLAKKKYIIFYLVLMWISILSIVLEFWIYWEEIFNWNFIFAWKITHFYIFLPLLCVLMYITIVFVSLFVAKIMLLIVNVFHKPKEGVFLREKTNKDYKYWSLRNTIKRWPVWLSHRFPFPFLDNICFKMFGVKTKFSNSLFEGWVDCEFIEFGKNVVVGQGSIIQSATIIGNLLIIKKTRIEENVRIGTHAIVMPGTIIRRNSVLAASSVTTVGQELEEGWIYVGIPAQKFKKNRFFEDGLKEIIGKRIEDEEVMRKKYEELYIRRHDEHSALRERVHVQKERLEEKIRERRHVQNEPSKDVKKDTSIKDT